MRNLFFRYVPMPEMGGWYIVSIVPNVEIMREANSIIQKTLFICFLIFVGFLIRFLIYLYITRGYQKEIYAPRVYGQAHGSTGIY